MKATRTIWSLAVGAICSLLTLAGQVPAAGGVTNVARAPWGRVMVVGASASAGFTVVEPFGGPETARLRLNRYIDAAIVSPHEPVQTVATSLFFLMPEAEGKRQIDRALEAQPTMVLGVDFLFWFCYGEGSTDEARLRRFEQGLKLLERVRCPVIVGDIPDASRAIETGMLLAAQVPSAEARSAANRRLKEWAASRTNVAVVPLAAFMRNSMANEPITIRGHAMRKGETRALLQDDHLHPAPLGTVFLALASLDAFVAARPGVLAKDVRWDPREVLRLGQALVREAPAVR